MIIIFEYNRGREVKKGKNSYLQNEGRLETNLAKLNIVQIIHKPPGIGNATPPKLVVILSHGKRGKHELKSIHQNPWCVRAHQLAANPLG